MAKSETVNVIILCQYSTLIMNKFLTNIINNPETQILIKKNTNPKLYEKKSNQIRNRNPNLGE